MAAFLVGRPARLARSRAVLRQVGAEIDHAGARLGDAVIGPQHARRDAAIRPPALGDLLQLARVRPRFRDRAPAAPPPASARSPAGKASGWPRQNSRKMSAVHGPIPLTATSARCASGAGISRERGEVEPAVARPPRATARQRADLRAREAAGAQAPPRRPRSTASARERAQRRFQPAEDRVGAGDRHLLRDDDRRQPRKARLAPPQRRRAADLDQPPDRLAVEREQRRGGFGQRRLAVDAGGPGS